MTVPWPMLGRPRSYVVGLAERHIKSDPEACFDSFCNLYVKAKADLEKGLGEPEAYDGPTPSFLPKELDRDVGLDHLVVQD